MTRRAIIDTAMKGLGMVAEGGDGYETLMPYLLGDVMYQIFLKDIAPLPLRGKMKQMRGLWEKKYSQFNKPVFSAFRDEDYTELTDMMDSLNEYLKDEITMLRSGVMLTLVSIDDFDRRRVVSSMLLCHMFAQYAESSHMIAYYHMRKTKYFIHRIGTSNPHLCFLRDISYKMAIQYIKETPGGDLELNRVDMQSTFNLIAKKIYNWLNEN